jgi:inward rectifier potassium channel
MKKHTSPSHPQQQPRIITRGRRAPRAIVRGQDHSRWLDVYHAVLTAPWWTFFVVTAGIFAAVNTVFALLYMFDPRGIEHARGFWDYFLFSVQTIGSANYTVMLPKTIYANVVVSVEAFFGILNLALITGVVFARFSRPFARVLFSRVAVIAPFNGVPTLMFRAANQRGNQILNAEVAVSLARQMTTTEGIVMRRFEELKLVRSRSPLFALSWTVMHPIDESSPLHGADIDSLYRDQVEIIILLSGRDDTLSDMIYARHSYMPDEILWNRRFVDVLDITPSGRRLLDLHFFHSTEPLRRD